MKNIPLAGGTTTIDLHSKWSGLLGIIQSALGASVMTTLGWIGLLLVIAGVVGWAWEKRKGSADHNKLIWSIVVGGILVAPQALYVILLLVDGIANTAIRVFGG